MQMGPKEIARDYRTAANKQKQIKVLAELNQCAERRIAEILDDEGEVLPKKWADQLSKPTRRSRKFPEGEATPEDDAPVSPSDRATDRDLFEAVATLLPEAAPVGADSIRPEPEEPAEVPVAPGNEDEARHWVDDVGPVATPSVTAAGGGDSSLKEGAKPGGISAEDLLRAACRLLGSALELEPDRYRTYSCGVLDLVHALTEEG